MNYLVTYLAGLVTLPLLLAIGYRIMRWQDARDLRRNERQRPHR